MAKNFWEEDAVVSGGGDWWKQDAVATPQKPVSTERTVGESVKDVGAAALTGLGSLAQVPGQIAKLAGLKKVGEALETPGEAISQYGEDLKSEGLKAREALRSQALSDAEKDGVLSQFATAIKTTLTDPALAASFVAEQVPLLIGPAGAAKVAQVLSKGKIAAAGAGLAGEEALAAQQAAAGAIGTTAARRTGYVMQGADVSSDTYDAAYKAAKEQGMSDEQAQQAALNASRGSFAGAAGVSALTSKLPGAQAIEKRLAGAPGAGRVASGVGEATSESLEEAGGQLFQNIALRQVDPNQSLTAGVGAAAGLGALGGGFFGSLLGKKAPEDLVPGQRPGETLYDTANRLNAQRGALDAEIEGEQAPKAPAIPDIFSLAGKPAEEGGGYAGVLKLQKELEALPKEEQTPETKKALEDATFVLDRLVKEELARKTPGAQPEQELPSVFDIAAKSVEEGGGYPGLLQLQQQLKALPPEQQTDHVKQTLQDADFVIKRMVGESLNRQTPQLKAAVITPKDLANFRVKNTDPLYHVIIGKDLTKPEDVAAVWEAIDAEATKEGNKDTVRGRNLFFLENAIDQFLDTLPGGSLYARPLIEQPSGTSPVVAGVPGGEPAAGTTGATVTDGVVSPAKDVGQVARRKAKQPAPVAEQPAPEVVEEAPIATEPVAEAPATETPAEPSTPAYDIFRLDQRRMGRVDKYTLASFRENAEEGDKATIDAVEKITADIAGILKNTGIDIADSSGAGLRALYSSTKPQMVRLRNSLGALAAKSTDLVKTSHKARLENKGKRSPDLNKAKKQLEQAIAQAELLIEQEAKPAKKSVRAGPGVSTEAVYKQLEQKAKVSRETKEEVKPEPEESEKVKALKVARELTVQQLEGVLKKILAKYNLAGVNLNLEEGMADAGSYSGKLIKIAMDIDNPVQTLRHESIHALKELGFFTDAQWKSLVDRANKEWIDTYLKNKNIDGNPLQPGEKSRYDAYIKEYNGDMDAIVEEAIADAFGDYATTKPPAGMLQAILTRMQNLFKAIREAMNLGGYETAEDIFGKIEQGKLKGKENEPAKARAESKVQPERAGKRGRRNESGSIAPLEGAPTIEGATGPIPEIVAAAEKYAKDNNIPLSRQGEYVEVDERLARRLAQAYDAMPHAPNDPAVKNAYQDLIKQVKDQYLALVKAGYKFTFFDSETDPYGGNPWNAMRDLRKNKTMAVYGTYDGFGTKDITDADVEDNPLLAKTGLVWPDQNGEMHLVTGNDLFRAVHDAFGHGMEGAGFRARGEENAWQAHARLFTGPALGAMTSETRGQNSWLNYGPYGEKNQTAKVEDTIFAQQKTGLMPAWAWNERIVGDDIRKSLRGGVFAKRLAEADVKTTDDFWKMWQNYMIGKGAVRGGLSSVGDNRSNTEQIKSFIKVVKADVEQFGLRKHLLGYGNPNVTDDSIVEASIPRAMFKNMGIKPTIRNIVFAYNSLDGHLVSANDADLIESTPDDYDQKVLSKDRGYPRKPKEGKDWFTGEDLVEPEPINDVRFSLRAPKTKAFKTFFGDSKIVNKDGEPKVMYHGTARDITEFKPKQANAIFVTDNPDTAERYAQQSVQWMADDAANNLSAKQMADTVKATKALLKENGYTDKQIAALFADKSYVKTDEYREAVSKYLETGPNVMPLYVRAENPFDYENPAHIKELMKRVPGLNKESFARTNNWTTIENPEVQNAIQEMGHDSFYVAEHGDKNLAVYSATQIKSATGNIGTYDILNPDIRKSLRSAADRFDNQELRKLAPVEYKSRYKLVEMPIDDFLALAKFGRDEVKLENARKLLAEGKQFSSIPYLYVNVSMDGEAQAVGHEGRHRAKALAELGYTTMPVELRTDNLRWSEQDDPKKFDYLKQWPTEIKAEKKAVYPDVTIDFPTREEAVKGYSNAKLSLRSSPALAQDIIDRVNATTVPRHEATFGERFRDATTPDTFTKIRQRLLNRYERLAQYDRAVAKKLKEMGGAAQLADSKAESAALFSDLGAGLVASAMGVHDRVGGIPVFKNGITKISNENNTVKGLIAIFKPLAEYGNPEVYRHYQFWSGVQRGMRLNQEGREKLFNDPKDLARAKQLEAAYPEFKQVHADWIKYNNGLIKYGVDTGVLSKESAAEMTKHGDYVPFYRLQGEEDTLGPRTFMSIANVKSLPTLKGGEGALGDFFENMVRNTQSIIQAGIKNTAAQRATQQALFLKQVERLDHKTSLPNSYRVLENGKEVYYLSKDPLFIEAIKSLNMAELPFMGLFAAPANLLRNLVTKDPGFMLANMMRDSLSAWTTSGIKMTPIASTIKQFGKAISGKSPELENLYNLGVLGGYDYAAGVKASGKELSKELRKAGKTPTAFEMVTSPITSLWGALEKGTSASDAATRMEVFKKVLEETGNEAEAMWQSLEIMNFNRKGNSAVVRVLTAAVPFLNARMQGLDVLYRAAIAPAFRADATDADIERMKTFWVRGATIMALSVAYWAMTHDDDEYLKQEQETRDNNWLIPSLGVKIPIPFEVGVMFKVIPERIMELAAGQDTGKDFMASMGRQLTGTFAFNPIPQTFLPIVENVTNYSFFTHRPIVGKGLEDVAPEYQVGPNTTKFAEWAGKQLGYSPIKIDHLVQGYTGTMGGYFADALDAFFSMNSENPRASKRFEQLPVIKRFALDPEARGNVTAYYELKDSVDEVVRTVNYLERTGNYEAYGEYLNDNISMFAAQDYVKDLEKTMKEFREMKLQIRSMPMEPDEKRDALRDIGQLEIQITSSIRQVKKSLQ